MFTSYFFLLIAGLFFALGVVLLAQQISYTQRAKQWYTNTSSRTKIACGLILVAIIIVFGARASYPVHFAMPPFMHSYAPGHMPASIPLPKIAEFFMKMHDFERVADIGADPNAVNPPAEPIDGVVRIELTAKEVVGEIAPGISFNYWTYNNQVPGPLLHVREGDTVEVVLHNDKSSTHVHNIDLHAVNGPGGGAAATSVAPGETKSFTWKALNPGVYVYHCANPNVSTHNSHGQYGLIVVQPKNPLPAVDKEFYVMQGELYTAGGVGKKGFVVFDSQALMNETPTYITMNGRLETTPRMQAKVGDRVRMYVGNGGVSRILSFHIIGEIFDVVYPEGAIGSAPLQNVQTTTVPAGGATIVEFTVDVPGTYLLVDHALSRMNRGAWAALEVVGEENPKVFHADDRASGAVY